jgi:branched-chain amino acid transport system permease protein
MTTVPTPPSEAEQIALLRPVLRTGLGLVALAAAWLVGPVLDPAIRTIATTGLMLSVLAQSWNVLAGLAGYANFGQVVFFGAGGYGVALLTTRASLSFWLALPLATMAAGALGVALGPLLLRLRAQYFALATLAVAAAASSAAMAFPGVTGGLPGLVITTLGPHRPGAHPGQAGFYIIFLLMAAVAATAVACIRHSRFGLALRLVRENEGIAGEFGVPTTWVKVAALGLSALLAGAAGSVFGFQQVTVAPGAMFDPRLTVLPIAIVMLGGLGSVAGPVFWAVFLAVISTTFNSHFPAAHTLVIGLLITSAAVTDPQRIMRRLRRDGGSQERLAGDISTEGASDATDRGPAVPAPRDGRTAAGTHISPWSRPGRTTGESVALDLRDVTVRFGAVSAVGEVTLHVKPGQTIGILGPNGAGKSTLLDTIGGRHHAAAGRIRMDTRDITGVSPWRLARAGVARTHQVPTPLWGFTVEENIAAGLLFRCRSARAARMRTDRLLAWADLTGRRHDRPDCLSIGELRRLDLARAAVARPRLLLIDEPLAGIPETDSETGTIIRMITDLRDHGATVVLVEHTLAAVLRLCDSVLVLHHGQPLAIGAPRAVLGQERVIGAYLGQRLNLRSLASTGHRPAETRT